jgi:hypothetical protein
MDRTERALFNEGGFQCSADAARRSDDDCSAVDRVAHFAMSSSTISIAVSAYLLCLRTQNEPIGSHKTEDHT